MDLGLAIAGALATLTVAALVAAWPWCTAATQGRRPPAAVLDPPQLLLPVLALTAGIGAGLWLALESASPGGLLGQRPILEQLVPLTTALLLGACLAVLPWRPHRVARELRRLALTLPVVSAAVLLVDGAMSGAGFMALVSGYLAVALAAAAGLLLIGRMLAHPRRRATRGPRPAVRTLTARRSPGWRLSG